MYVQKAELARIFGVTYPTVCSRVKEIEQEIGKRYTRYATIDLLVSIEVYADWEKYRKRLKDKNLRKTVPPFNMGEAREYLVEEGFLHVICKEVRTAC